MSQDRRSVWGWALYDWANSAFATTVVAGFFPIFFKQYWSTGADVNTSTAQLGFGNALASLLVALFAPLLGAIADQASVKKRMLGTFAYLGVLGTAALFLVEQGNWLLAIFVYVIASIGFSGANIFYDALLPSIAGESRIDYVSSFGYALGYLGGGLLFLVNVLMTLNPDWFGLADAGEAVRWSFVTVALWWGGFTVFTLVWVPEPDTGRSVTSGAISAGIRQLGTTLRKLKQLRTVMLFLVAYWFYIDGVDTIIRMAVDYGISIGFESTDLITALLLVQFVGFPAALVWGKLGQHWGVRKSIFLCIAVYMAVTIWGTQMREKWEFYALAAVIGLVQGGVQALSRSYYSRLIPLNQAAEFYGFYNMLGKFAAILGPVLMGLSGLVARSLLMPADPTEAMLTQVGQESARWSIASIILLFLIGGYLFWRVDETQGRKEIRNLQDAS